MERKTVHALLLSLAVVAGGVMMTTDAYAQTNTERLMTTVDNTNSILSALNALADAVASGFASVLAAIGMVEADTEAIMTEIGHVEGELADVSSSVQSVQSDVAGLSDDISDINSNVQSVKNDLTNLAGIVSGSATGFSTLTDNVGKNAAAINELSDKLDMISTAVGAVQTTVETQEDVDPAVTNMLHTAETEQTVAVADFAGAVAKHPTDGVYEASNTFSCTGDVFLDSMAITDVDAALYTITTIAGYDRVPKTTVSLNGVNLYEVYDNDSPADSDALPANALQITKDRDFDNQFLSAGSTLVVKGSTDQSADGDDTPFAFADIATRGAQNVLEYEFNATAGADEGANVYFTLQDYVNLKSNKATINATDTVVGGGTNQATKVQLGTTELYTITVKWFAASSDTTCSITSAVETTSGLPNTDNTVLVALNIDSGADVGPPTPFTAATLDCNGEDTEITGVSIQAGGIAGLNQFIEVELTADGEPASVSFGDDNRADADASDLPFRFSGSDLTVSGEGIGTLLLQVTYDTTQGNTCKAS